MSDDNESIGAKVEPFAKAITDPSSLEDEIQCMSWIVDGMEPLDKLARRRVLEWAQARYRGPDDGNLNISLIGFLTELLDAIAKHRDAIGTADDADVALYEATLKGTRYDTMPVGEPQAQ